MKHLMTYGSALILLTMTWWCAEPSLADTADNGRITTEQEYRDLVVGKKLGFSHGYFVSHEDGVLTGEVAEKQFSGTWTWNDQYLCRTGTLGEKKLRRRCYVIVVSGDEVTYIRDKGKGKEITYRMRDLES